MRSHALAFEILSHSETTRRSPSFRSELIATLGQASGCTGMGRRADEWTWSG